MLSPLTIQMLRLLRGNFSFDYYISKLVGVGTLLQALKVKVGMQVLIRIMKYRAPDVHDW